MSLYDADMDHGLVGRTRGLLIFGKFMEFSVQKNYEANTSTPRGLSTQNQLEGPTRELTKVTILFSSVRTTAGVEIEIIVFFISRGMLQHTQRIPLQLNFDPIFKNLARSQRVLDSAELLFSSKAAYNKITA